MHVFESEINIWNITKFNELEAEGVDPLDDLDDDGYQTYQVRDINDDILSTVKSIVDSTVSCLFDESTVSIEEGEPRGNLDYHVWLTVEPNEETIVVTMYFNDNQFGHDEEELLSIANRTLMCSLEKPLDTDWDGGMFALETDDGHVDYQMSCYGIHAIA